MAILANDKFYALSNYIVISLPQLCDIYAPQLSVMCTNLFYLSIASLTLSCSSSSRFSLLSTLTYNNFDEILN